MRWLRLTLLIMGMALLVSAPLAAQDEDEQTYDVWVTTQDYSVLREGPSREFEKIVTVDSALTMPAIGRTYQGDWLQVVWTSPEGEQINGWIASWLLIWTGNILELPVDGVDPEPFARESGPLITLEPGTYYYRDEISLANQVAETVTEPTQVEITGRIGTLENGSFLIQFRLDGEYYLTASWAVPAPRGYLQAADASYIYVFGRLRTQLATEIDRSYRHLSPIRRRWESLAIGEPTGCRFSLTRAAFAEDYLREQDIRREPIFEAPVTALIQANIHINDAIDRFEAVCDIPAEERIIGPDEIDPALEAIANAENSLRLAELQLPGLQLRDPFLGRGGE